MKRAHLTKTSSATTTSATATAAAIITSLKLLTLLLLILHHPLLLQLLHLLLLQLLQLLQLQLLQQLLLLLLLTTNYYNYCYSITIMPWRCEEHCISHCAGSQLDMKLPLGRRGELGHVANTLDKLYLHLLHQLATLNQKLRRVLVVTLS